MLHLNKLSLVHDRVVLDEVSFSLKQGEIIGLVGKSGAGKTSILKIVGGHKDPTSGDVIFEDKKVLGPSIRLVPGHDEIQLVNQDFGLDIYHTVEQNVREKILYLPTKARNQFVDELLELVELDFARKQQAHTLSGGEQQRLSIARALACEPKLLLLDEPFVHLDTRLRLKITNYLLEMKQVRNMSIILVSHDGAEVLSLCDKILYVKNGKIKRTTSPRNAYYQFQSKEEGELYGWVNSAVVNNKRVYFRTDEFEVDNTKNAELKLEFKNSTFCGGFYLSNFVAENKKKIVLLSIETLNHVKGINIRKKIHTS